MSEDPEQPADAVDPVAQAITESQSAHTTLGPRLKSTLAELFSGVASARWEVLGTAHNRDVTSTRSQRLGPLWRAHARSPSMTTSTASLASCWREDRRLPLLRSSSEALANPPIPHVVKKK